MSEFLDELARSLAEPMPRRRALSVLGVTLVGLATGGNATGARGPFAARIDKCGRGYKVCSPATEYCHVYCCATHTVCSPGPVSSRGCQISPGCCDPCNPQKSTPDGKGGCKPGPVADTCCKKKCGKSKCCGDDEKCCTGKGRATCCPAKQDCINGRCGCKSGGKKCGDQCCDKGDQCCGTKCCDANAKCCDDHCCRESATCCGNGCCKEGTRCYKDGDTFRCCPEERLSNTPAGKVCCPPYYYVQWGNTCCRTGRTCTQCDPPCRRGHYCQDGYCLQA